MFGRLIFREHARYIDSRTVVKQSNRLLLPLLVEM